MKKQEVKRITGQIILFFKAMASLSAGIAKQLVLPNANRKGNILSTILLLFVSLADLVATFSRDFVTGDISQWKYYGPVSRMIRKSVLFTGVFLFLLSSVEWSCSTQPQLSSTSSIAATETHTHRFVSGTLLACPALVSANKAPGCKQPVACRRQEDYSHPHFPPVDICLRNHNFRI